jgi:hypothetical protein
LVVQRESKATKGDAPLTAAEQQAAAERQLEVAVGSTREYVHGLAFPVQPPLAQALAAFASGGPGSLVVMALAAAGETMELAGQRTGCPAGELQAALEPAEPRFALYRYAHPGGSAVCMHTQWSCNAAG